MKQHGKLKNTKRKKWRKGHSSESNPEIKKYRAAAKNKFFHRDQGPSNLTVEALAKHDATENDADGDAILSDMDTASQGGQTFNTWASNWTDCTNTTFSRVHRYWNSNSALHKEILAILAAITEVIKTQGGNETEVEYFAALMTAMETVDNEMAMAAVTYLLSLAIKRVPASILRSRFSDVSKALLEVMAKHAESDAPSLLRSVVSCLASLLRVQDQATWSRSSTMKVYDALLSFITHPKPKVRRSVQHAVRIILKASVFMTQADPPPYHPAANATAKYCVHIIEQSGSTDQGPTLQSLELLKYVLAVFPQASVKSCCETILRVMTLSNVVITSVSMRVLHTMFTMQPKATNLPAELNSQIINALYDYEPGENDLQPMAAWLAVMEAAHINLARLDHRLCSRYLPRIFTAAMKCLQTDRPEVAQAAAKALIKLLKECVGPEAAALSEGHMKATSPTNKMFTAVEKGLGYQYQASWKLVLQVLETFFDVFSTHCPGLMNKCLLSMADLRDSYGFPYKQELDRAVGMAIRRMGPQAVLQAIPLDITGEEDNYQFPRSWLLPVIRDYTQETELAFFASYFLPLAVKLRTKAIEFADKNQTVEAKTYEALQLQIWSMLPGFCTNPTDLKSSFKGVARILGSALTDRPDVRMDTLASLRKLINQNLEHAENKAELARFAKNFLPLLFNLFTVKPEDERDMTRQAVLETVKTYLQITDASLVSAFFAKAHGKLIESDVSDFRKHALMDLTIGMVAYINKKELAQLYTLVIQQLESSDHTMQKKAYRILEEICSGKSQQNKAFVTSHLEELQSALLKSLSSSSPSSKAPRLRCLVHVFKQLEEPQVGFLRVVLPEAILCTKETAEKARTAAYRLLIEMAATHLRWAGSEKPQSEALLGFFELLLAGLAGSPHMISATTNALTRIIYEYKASISTPVLDTMVDNVCVLLASKTREIVQSVMGLLKVLLSVFTDATLAQYLKQIIEALTNMKEDTRRHFRLKNRQIFAKLIKKFGFETLVKMVPDSYNKVLSNIRKLQARSKKKKALKDNAEQDDGDEEFKPKSESITDLLRDTDSELEEDSDDKPKKGQKKQRTQKKKSGAWLKEGEEDVIDFLDPSVAKKVLATQPSEEKGESKVQHSFKTAPDGRMIISLNEDDDDGKDNTKGKKKGKKLSHDEEMEDLSDLLDTLEGPSKKSRKRRLSDSLDMDDDEGTGPMQYKAGGTGIHRPLDSPPKKQKKEAKEPGAEYRAKKAGGDIKKKNLPSPYAYVPLHHSALNKRKQKKLKGQYTNLVKGAKKGAAKGKKLGSKARKK